MFLKRFIVIFAVALAMAFSVNAQNTPRDVSDLVGTRAPGGGTQLQRRGFRLVDSAKGNDIHSHWFRKRSSQCIMVVTEEGRFSDIAPSKTSECK